MKYLKYYEAFYSPAKQIYKGNIGTDKDNDTGFNTFPLDSFNVNDEGKAFNEGEEAFNKGIDIEDNPYSGQQYQNPKLITSWMKGWYNGHRNKKMENVEVDFAGNMILPTYLEAEAEDDINIAYEKGRDAKQAGCDEDENPYISLNSEEDMAIQGMYYAWEDGWNSL